MHHVIASARDLHMTPHGSGVKDGGRWEDALDGKEISRVVNEVMKPGDRLLVAGGEYRDVSILISAGGELGAAKVIEGLDRGGGLPIFVSTWRIETPARGGTAIVLDEGVDHLKVQGLRLQGWQFGVRAREDGKSGARRFLTFSDVDMDQVRHGFYLSDCDDLVLRDCDLRRYSKHGFRFESGCDRVQVQRCTADCSEGDGEWEKKTESLPFGFVVQDGGAPNTHLVFEDCLARNNMMPLQKNRYKNGDGFVVEGNSVNVEFRRCRSLRNQDGGFDLKVADVRLTDCVATGNKRDYRIWNGGTLENCFSGWSNTGLWSNGAAVMATRCTFFAINGPAAMTDDRATGAVSLVDCVIVPGKDAAKGERLHGDVKMKGSAIAGVEGAPEDPGFKKVDPAWNGIGDVMDAVAFSGKGYRYRESGRR